MGTERSDKAYAAYVEASQKFDYFVVGLSVALVGYLGAGFRAVPLGWNPPTVELAAIAALLLSAIAGLKRIESNVTLLGTSQRRLWEQEAAGGMKSAAMGGGPALNKGTGQVLGSAQLITEAYRHQIVAEVMTRQLEQIAQQCDRWYRVRNFLLVFGLALLVLARLLVAYIP